MLQRFEILSTFLFAATRTLTFNTETGQKNLMLRERALSSGLFYDDSGNQHD